MRQFLCSLFLIIFMVQSGFAEQGWPKNKSEDPRGLTNTLTGKHAENMMRLVSNLPWLPDPDNKEKNSKKYLYVIYTPSCSISQEFYKASRKFADKVQIRWIPVDPEGGSLNSMYEHRTGETVRKAFNTSMVPPDKDPKKTENINMYSSAGIAYLLLGQILSPDQILYFPTLVYGTPEKAFVTIGPVKNLDKLVKGLPETTETEEPEAVGLGAQKTDILIVKSAPLYKNEGKERAAIRLVPDSKGVDIGGFLPGKSWPLPVKGVTENGFVAFVVSSKGAPIFIEDPEFVKRVLAKK